jgi:hypothetical protein
MQFFFLLLFNVFLGAVLYLVISLKLERSATEYRQRRFRKEMDEIIKEFNVTAERNIAILEARIRLMKKILEKSGDLQAIDVTLVEEEAAGERSSRCDNTKTINGTDEERESSRADSGSIMVSPDANNPGSLIKKGLLLFFNKYIHIRTPDNPGGTTGQRRDLDSGCVMRDFSDELRQPLADRQRVNSIIQKEFVIGNSDESAMDVPGKSKPGEEEIAEIVDSAKDRYSLISVLFHKGCTVDEIADYSGIPAGEVRLVLNLKKEILSNP